MHFDLSQLEAKDRYKLIAGLVVPRPIALVTTLSADGRHNAAPYSFFNAFSEDPPLIVLGVGANVRGEDKDTGVNIREGGEFVINLVDEPLAEAMNICAIDFPPEISEIDAARLELLPSEQVAPARLKAAPVSMECVHYQTLHPGENRYLVIGEIKVIHVQGGIVDPDSLRVDRDRYAPIGRLFGGGYCRTNDRFEIRRMTVEEGLERSAAVIDAVAKHGDSQGRSMHRQRAVWRSPVTAFTHRVATPGRIALALCPSLTGEDQGRPD